MPEYKQGKKIQLVAKLMILLYTLVVQLNLHRRIFFFKKICYEVIVKHKIYKRPTNHYSHRPPCGLTDVVIDWEGERGGRI
jgi:hypothetical protein